LRFRRIITFVQRKTRSQSIGSETPPGDTYDSRVRVRAAALLFVLLLTIGLAVVWLNRDAIVLQTVPVTAADARADRELSDADVARLARTIERSVAYVEGLFQRPFASPPKVLLFATRESFSEGLSARFGYSEGTVTFLATNHGGVFDPATSTIAMSLEALGTSGVAPTLEHELTHLMVREATAAHALPTWFEEGLATVAERQPAANARWLEQDALVARAIAATGRVSLAQVDTLEAWHATYPRFGDRLYAYAAETVRLMRTRVEWPGFLEMLASVSAGQDFAEAYRSGAGETLAQLEARLKAVQSAIITRTRPAGDVEWTLFTGAPLAPTTVTISGTSTYVVTFTVTTDDLGIYRGTFGSTAPLGAYILSAAGARAEITTSRL
jgi:hypothetical protein